MMLAMSVPGAVGAALATGDNTPGGGVRWAAPVERGDTAWANGSPASADLRIAQAIPLASPPAQLPTATAKSRRIIFSEDFSGTEFSKAWEVVNPNPDHYIAEGGALLIIAQSAGGFAVDKSENVFRLIQKLPDSDWVITVSFNVTFQTLRENLMFGLRNDSKNFIATQLYTRDLCCFRSSDLVLKLIKVSSGQTTQFELPVTPTKEAAQPVSVRLTRKAHEYRAGVNFAGQVDKDGKAVWVETGSVTSLHPPTTFVLNASQWEGTSGESSFRINSVMVETTAK